jgi:hypothetical protein
VFEVMPIHKGLFLEIKVHMYGVQLYNVVVQLYGQEISWSHIYNICEKDACGQEGGKLPKRLCTKWEKLNPKAKTSANDTT